MTNKEKLQFLRSLGTITKLFNERRDVASYWLRIAAESRRRYAEHKDSAGQDCRKAHQWAIWQASEHRHPSSRGAII